MKITVFPFLTLMALVIFTSNGVFADTCPDQSKVTKEFEMKGSVYVKCESGKMFKIGATDFGEIDEKEWDKTSLKYPGLEPQLKLCTFYTDEMMIDCPQAIYIRSDLINDPKLEPFFKLKVHLQDVDTVKEKKLKKMKYLDSNLKNCTYYTDKMMIDCPQGLYIRNDLVKNPKIVQFIEQKKKYDNKDPGSLKSTTGTQSN